LLAFLVCGATAGLASPDAETRVLDYIRTHIQPGQPLVVTDLYNRMFTQPDERQALNKLYNAFFRIPLFVANYQEKFGSPPTLAVVAEQFDLRSPGAADVLLRVMESDPRVPRFLIRDPRTGEITHVDVEKIKANPKFGQALTRQISGWEGNPAPDFTLPRLGSGELHMAELQGKVVLLEVWFTGCPPCMQETPALVSLDQELSSRGLAIVGANADRTLGLNYDDSVRQRYVKEHRIAYPIVHWTTEGDHAYGGISIFPTLFLIDRKGMVRGHWIGYVQIETLRQAITEVLKGN
jgi:peroxiredoxin